MNPCCDVGDNKAAAEDITKRNWLFIDVDPKRPKGLCATDAEKQLAEKKRDKVFHWLIQKGVPPEAILTLDSGNGYHLYIHIDLPNDQEANDLVSRFLACLKDRFSDEEVEIDTGVKDPSRLAKTPGTWVRKGELTNDRYYRVAGEVMIGCDSGAADPHNGCRNRRYQFWPIEWDTTPLICPREVIEKIAGPAEPRRARQHSESQQRRGKVPVEPVMRLLRACWETAEPFKQRSDWMQQVMSILDLCGDTPEVREAIVEWGCTDDDYNSQDAIDGNLEIIESIDPPEERGGGAITYRSIIHGAKEQISELKRQEQIDDLTGEDTTQLESRIAEAKSALQEVEAWLDRDQNAPVDSPDRLADTFLESLDDGPLTYRKYRGEWYRYDAKAGCSRKVPESEVSAEIGIHVKSEFEADAVRCRLAWLADPNREKKQEPREKKVTCSVVRDAIAALSRRVQIRETEGTETLPFWHTGQHVRKEERCLPFGRSLLRLDQLRQGKVDFRPSTPELFTVSAIPYAWNPNAECPQFLQMLERSTGGDEGLKKVIQEMFGSFLWPTGEFHKFYLVVGDGGTGKSALRAALQAFIGVANCAALRLEDLDKTFAMQGLLGKAAYIVEEISRLDGTAEGVLKALCSEAPLRIDRKFLEPLTISLTGKLVCFVNELPRFSDATYGTWRRPQHIPLNIRVKPDEIVRGMDRPEFWQSERQGICVWAVEGLIRLLQNGGSFSALEACDAMLRQHRGDCNPAERFLDEWVGRTGVKDEWVECSRLYDAYRDYCFDHGHRPLESVRFGRIIQRQYGDGEELRTRIRRSGRRVYCYQGLSLRSEFVEACDGETVFDGDL